MQIKKWNLNQITRWTNGEALSTFETEFETIGTDTRKSLESQIFIALKGDAFDAHAYLDLAVNQGAKALLVHELPEKFQYLKTKVSIILVKDTLVALQNFAHEYRLTLKTKIIGITGSNGKTTTKEFTAQILSQYKKTHYSKGSFNNHWGVPMTLLDIPLNADFAVVEMGMNHAGEIKKLAEIAVPDVVVCTMVGSAHIEFFGSQKEIAKAKSEIYLETNAKAIRIFNQDQDLTFDMMYPVAKKYPKSRMLSFSEKNTEADVFFQISELKMKQMLIKGIIAAEPGTATLNIFGKQNLTNLMAAATIAYVCGLKPEQIWQALPHCKTAWGRNQFIDTSIGAEILFDGYNANPDSMHALLENVPLLNCLGKKIGIFGQMKELGSQSIEAHIELGRLAGGSDFSEIYFIGEDAESFKKGLLSSQYKGLTYIENIFKNELGEILKKTIKPNDMIIIKGSRGAETERFVPFCSPIEWANK